MGLDWQVTNWLSLQGGYRVVAVTGIGLADNQIPFFGNDTQAIAHIQRDRVSNEYRLFNDRWYSRGGDCGTWIVRDGMSQEVHRNGRGARLEPGDEIHLGRAVVVFEE